MWKEDGYTQETAGLFLRMFLFCHAGDGGVQQFQITLGIQIAWFWLAAHVFFLIGFRNRIVVLLNWAVAYWSYQRSARIIFGDDQEDRRPRP